MYGFFANSSGDFEKVGFVDSKCRRVEATLATELVLCLAKEEKRRKKQARKRASWVCFCCELRSLNLSLSLTQSNSNGH